jgi:hypothetical protein
MTTVSVKSTGAIGDGVTDDTRSIQIAIDSGDTILFPDAPKFYRITKSLLIGGTNQVGGKRLIGERNCRGGFGIPLIQGSGGFPLFLMNGTSLQNRSILLFNLSASQVANSVLSANFAANLFVDECFFQTTSNKLATVSVSNSSGVTIRESTILCSGDIPTQQGGWALTAYGQCNVLRIMNNQFAGGSLGGAVHIEQSETLLYQGNRTELGVYGLVVGSGVNLLNPTAGNVTGAGPSNGVTIQSNYFENIEHSLVIASANNLPNAGIGQAIFGLLIQGNMIGVKDVDNPLIVYGRVGSGVIWCNSLWRKAGGTAVAIRSTFPANAQYPVPLLAPNSVSNGSGAMTGP